MAVNIGTLAAGIGSGIKNIGTTMSTMQQQVANAGLSGARQRDLDFAHQNLVTALQGRRNYLKSLGKSDDEIDMYMAAGGDANSLKTLQDVYRTAAMDSPYFKMAQALNGGGEATPQGVVQASQALQEQIAPDGLRAPYTEGNPALIKQAQAQAQAAQQRAAQESAQNVAGYMNAIKQLGSMNQIINGKNQYGVNNQGVEYNRLTGDTDVYDEGIHNNAVESGKALTNQRNASAAASSARAQKTRSTTGNRGNGGHHGGGHGRGRGSSRSNNVITSYDGKRVLIDKRTGNVVKTLGNVGNGGGRFGGVSFHTDGD